MAKTTGPLLSISARGTIAKTQTYSSWKGIPYVRKHVIPANPKTTDQMKTRNALRFLHDLDKSFGPLMRGLVDTFVKGKALTTHNVFIMWNLPRVRSATDMALAIFSDSAGSGFPPATVTPTGGSGSITITGTAPALPAGWSVERFIGVAVSDIDPHGESPATGVHEGSDTTDPYSVVLSGLPAHAYLAGGFFKYVKPDGSAAYGKSIQSVVSAT